MNGTHVHVHRHLAQARRIATLLDTQFRIGKFRFGVDPLMNLAPGIGTGVTTALSLYLFWIALSLGLPKTVYMRMVWNILLDFILGAVPVMGTVADFFYKANMKNLELLEDYIGSSVTLEGHVV